MLVLIDADIVAYRCASSAENDGEEIALLRVEELMRKLLADTQADEYKAFLTGGNNFRKEINSEYKAHRKDKPIPQYLNICREYLVSEWKASITDGYEADDSLGFSQVGANSETCICSIDKDLLMIPGLHYNWVKGEFKTVSELDGIKHFYKQMLIGDTADNIKGVDKIGPVKAAKLIDPLIYEYSMCEIVSSLYNDGDRFQMNADCLWIWRQEGEQYTDRLLD